MDAIDQEFCRMTEDILSHPLFLKMREQCHHGGENSLYIHSLSTAECAYRMARRFRMKEARVRAERRLSSPEAGMDTLRAEMALKRALVRLGLKH